MGMPRETSPNPVALINRSLLVVGTKSRSKVIFGSF